MIDMDYYMKLVEEDRKKEAEAKRRREEEYRKELESKGIIYIENKPLTEEEKFKQLHGWAEHPNTMENSTATFLWIVAMVVSLLFKGGWIMCILETIVWFKFVTRHNNDK